MAAGASRSRALDVRAPQLVDEAQVRAAQDELAADGFAFVLMPRESWPDCLARLEHERTGRELEGGRVPATMLFGLVGDVLVGRVSIRHELTPALELVGGHVGYGVRPAHRRRGYATRLLAAGLDVLHELRVPRALVTCDEGNVASASTIERNGGVLENTVNGPHGPKRRYWIDLVDRSCEPRGLPDRPGEPSVARRGDQAGDAPASSEQRSAIAN